MDGSDRSVGEFISGHVDVVKPLNKKARLAYWAASRSGESEDFDRYSELIVEIDKIYSCPKDFALLKKNVESDEIQDPLLVRQVKMLYNRYLTNQISPELIREMVELSSDISRNFNTFRGQIDGKEYSNNELTGILKTETDSEKLRQAWSAAKQVGPAVSENIVELVKLRNSAAGKVGFENYHQLALAVGEQDVQWLDSLLTELEELTRVPYLEMKDDLDKKLARRYGINTDQLRPWHYQDPFFQRAPMVERINIDHYYRDRDIEALSVEFFNGIGFDVSGILANSDLYERQGKNPQAFSTDIDKEGDVRILCNLRDNAKWMDVQLHELGHAVYSKYHDRNVPYLLRNPAHSFTTEAVSMLFGRLAYDAVWMQEMMGLSDAMRAKLQGVTAEHVRRGQLIFARWGLVMYNFEKQLYADPDQDLNTLWWDMVEKYQFVNRPDGRNEPDWASKLHFTQAPCYYHNYLLGEMLASQMHHDMVRKIDGMKTDWGISYVGRKEISEYLRTNIFEPGNVYHYNEMIKRATGRELTARYFAADFVR